ncbi:DUF317 domain-containing protein [Kitasatospora sp. NPDC058190]|uniref:DUF317 domain-containing protein n=1 Tax=Kitasatospora sp. NPDC058190 TaxID=3346371 RepID=UPI0036DDE03A
MVLAYNWDHSYNRDLDQTFVSSPDHRFRIGLNQLDPGAWWRISAAREPLDVPQWQAGFSKDTPAELIAAVTDKLHYNRHTIDWTGETHPALKQGAFGALAIADALAAAGWRELQDTAGVRRFETADGLARAELRPDADPLDLMAHPALHVEVGPADAGIPYWQALFTADTPALVTTAFVQALTDPAPLRRDADWMDEHLLAHLGRGDADTAEDTAAQLPFTDEDIRKATARVLSTALEWADYNPPDDIWEVFADAAIPSRGVPFRDLPKDQAALATRLVIDLVVDAADRTELLVDLPAIRLEPRTSTTKTADLSDLELSGLGFTNADLYAAAADVCEHQIHWGDDPSGIAELLHDEAIASTSGNTATQLTWCDLEPAAREQAHKAVHAYIALAGESTHALFTPRDQLRAAPLVTASPVFLAGPGPAGESI